MPTKQQQFIDDLESAYTQKGFALGKAAGVEIGKAEGAAEATLNLAKNFLAQGLSAEVVAYGTGLSLAEVCALKAHTER